MLNLNLNLKDINCFIGLGNDLEELKNTKHNIGVDFIDYIFRNHEVLFPSDQYSKTDILDYKEIEILKINSLSTIDGLCFIKLKTNINLSGELIKKLIDSNIIFDLTKVVIVYDDMDLNIGDFKLKNSGNKHHNGIKNIYNVLYNEQNKQLFKFLKIGIGKKDFKNHEERIKYVLSSFNKDERKLIEEVFVKISNSFNKS